MSGMTASTPAAPSFRYGEWDSMRHNPWAGAGAAGMNGAQTSESAAGGQPEGWQIRHRPADSLMPGVRTKTPGGISASHAAERCGLGDPRSGKASTPASWNAVTGRQSAAIASAPRLIG